MRIGDVLYFSPRFKFAQLDLDTPGTMILAIRDRVEGFYLQPASRCLEARDTFAGGIVCCAAIDFLATVCEEIDPEEWLRKYIPKFGESQEFAKHFWIRFRHGLVHEGYIKGQGQFSLDTPELLTTRGNILIVNARLLLEAVDDAFKEYCSALATTQLAQLTKRLHRYFDAEIEAARLD